MPLPEQQRATLLGIARDSIEHGLREQTPLPVQVNDFEAALRVERATFVTLHRHGLLRGCIGMLEACRPLVVDVAANAFAAAFEDPRFAPLSASELDELAIHISILSPPEPMAIASEEDLLRQLRPGVDGLIIQDGYRKATFLPSVWEELPDPTEFLAHLKRKAGLRSGAGTAAFRAWRYSTESIP